MKIFELTILGYSLTLKKIVKPKVRKYDRDKKKSYMKRYQRKHKDVINANRRKNYNNNLNGQRDRKRAYAKLNK